VNSRSHCSSREQSEKLDTGHGRAIVAAVIRGACSLVVATLCGCSCAGSNGVAPRASQEEEAPRPEDPFSRDKSSMRVGNQAAGVEEQPDYDAQAKAIRDVVEDRLPDPLPEPKAACVAMYDAAIAVYTESEGAASPPVRSLQKTRRDGIEACQAETSPAAAACVAVLAASDGGEFPWLLDQCSRAFP
jgi:hypothetical protein